MVDEVVAVAVIITVSTATQSSEVDSVCWGCLTPVSVVVAAAAAVMVVAAAAAAAVAVVVAVAVVDAMTAAAVVEMCRW